MKRFRWSRAATLIFVVLTGSCSGASKQDTVSSPETAVPSRNQEGKTGVKQSSLAHQSHDGGIVPNEGKALENQIPQDTRLFDVWGSGPDDVFVVGSKGAILHYDGKKWTTQVSGAIYDLLGIWGSGRDNVFAVGFEGMVIHYDGKQWTTQKSGTPHTLRDIWGSGPGHVFAVGEDRRPVMPAAAPWPSRSPANEDVHAPHAAQYS